VPLYRVTFPALFLWGEEDGVTPTEHGRGCRTITKAGHILMLISLSSPWARLTVH
jgi:pimeloyl-ACP methyl ester carboxylesterase